MSSSPESAGKQFHVNDDGFLELVVRYQDGDLSPEELQRLSDEICSDTAKRKLFQKTQLRTARIHDLLRMDAFGDSSEFMGREPDTPKTAVGRIESRKSNFRFSRYLQVGLVAVALLGMLALFLWSKTEDSIGVKHEEMAVEAPQISDPVDKPSVLLIEEVRAKFFGSAELVSGAVVESQRDYMLQSGMVKLKFPHGATTIIEAPAAFHVASNNRLLLNSGSCSVHAPPGAEGFEVLTPLTRVVDRGTRFFVNVKPNNETEVHVIEGAADLYTNSEGTTEEDTAETTSSSILQAEVPLQLKGGEAVRVGGFADLVGEITKFGRDAYLPQLPDRLIEYTASTNEFGGADELESIAVQRGGQRMDYSVDELIPVEVTWFCADSEPDSNGFLAGHKKSPHSPASNLKDRKLATGIINFGGQPRPMPYIPSSDSDVGVPAEEIAGLGIRFTQPLVNQQGPDFVLFEVQMFSNPHDGDPFHVYPMPNRTGLKPMTVTKFDIPLDSPIAREVTPLWSHRFSNPIRSLGELGATEAPLKVNVSYQHFRAIGVGIDLSDMGYLEGEEVEALFFQHAAEGDASKVDPVFIAGLPPFSAQN
ncbi:FecR domain-containing protein [Calycomorphotria hydatis]|uniref:FecR protein n=1 Tax=Calycomorphotria hydatis TaxID=2528027 RepID=A0A517T9W8_9PLAN|nr:FecR domain-containing protein [Calycomorphotria hydatis]QDT65149.1 FecR protein [Calycomorphotria hydatis]